MTPSPLAYSIPSSSFNLSLIPFNIYFTVSHPEHYGLYIKFNSLCSYIYFFKSCISRKWLHKWLYWYFCWSTFFFFSFDYYTVYVLVLCSYAETRSKYCGFITKLCDWRLYPRKLYLRPIESNVWPNLVYRWTQGKCIRYKLFIPLTIFSSISFTKHEKKYQFHPINCTHKIEFI